MNEARYFPNEGFRLGAGKVMGVASIILGTYAILILPIAGVAWVLLNDFIFHSAIPAIGFGVFALLAVPRQPFNNSVWVAVWAGLFAGVAIAGYSSFYALAVFSGVEGSVEVFKTITPADLPVLVAIFATFISIAQVSFVLVIVPGVILFPNGELPASKWRYVIWAALFSSFLFALAIALEFRPSSTTAYNSRSSEWSGGGLYLEVLVLLTIGLGLSALVSAVLRYRQSEGVLRLQFRWMGLGCGMFVLALVVAILAPGPFVAAYEEGRIQWVSTLIGIVSVLAAYAIAVAKYRLYDIDIVVSRTFVYGSLALFITAVYVAVVVGFGFLHGGDDLDIWLGIAATVVIALAFQPLRRRLERVANRLVYGRRATPYEVLSSFSQNVAAIDPGVLDEVARTLTEGTTADAATIWVATGDRLRPVASYPSIPESEFQVSEAAETADITHDGEPLGVIGLHLQAGQPFSPLDRSLLDQVAGGLGLTLRNLQLTSDLRSRVDDLRQSRRRVVALQDQTRRMLERDLHDGAQQRLVALKIKVGLGRTMAEKQELRRVKGILDEVKDETDLTIESLRDLARGIYPPLLEAEGLGPALAAQLSRSPVPVTVQAAGIERQPRDVEATVYFCVLEAVQNAVRHARANSVLVTLDDDNDQLAFEVRDDGLGFDPLEVIWGHGLQTISDRLDALNGTFDLWSSTDHGTAVVGTIPITLKAQV